MEERPKYLVLHVMGDHAGEDSESILVRKSADINKIGKTFWLSKSRSTKPKMTQKFCTEAIKQNCDPLCFFIEPSSKGGAKDTAKGAMQQRSIHLIHQRGIHYLKTSDR
jgi:hypothetical protein